MASPDQIVCYHPILSPSLNVTFQPIRQLITLSISTLLLYKVLAIMGIYAPGRWMGIIWCHYINVIMTTIESKITSLTVVYSTAYSDADQRKHQSSASLAFVWWIHRDRWIPRTKGQLRGKCFHLMTSSCHLLGSWAYLGWQFVIMMVRSHCSISTFLQNIHIDPSHIHCPKPGKGYTYNNIKFAFMANTLWVVFSWLKSHAVNLIRYLVL